MDNALNVTPADTEAERHRRLDADLKTTSSWALRAFLLGWVAIVLRFVILAFGVSHPVPDTKVGAGSPLVAQMFVVFIWSLAWLAGGFLLGFLFGVPKAISQNPAASGINLGDSAMPAPPKFRVNTNLEEISDWLTKVLVGATLTQIIRIPHFIARVAEFMSRDGEGNGAAAASAAVLLYYISLGFLSGYILTRTFFARAFTQTDI